MPDDRYWEKFVATHEKRIGHTLLTDTPHRRWRETPEIQEGYTMDEDHSAITTMPAITISRE